MTHTAAKKEMELSRTLHIRTHGFPYSLWKKMRRLKWTPLLGPVD
jgi:hypothetical protein